MPHMDAKYIDSSNSTMYNLRYIEKYISYILIGIMKNGELIAVGTVEELNALAGADRFEETFVRLCTGEGETV